MRRDIWSILTPILGLTLWFVLFWLPIQIEWSAPDARSWALAVYLAPVAVLIFGVVTRWSSLLLFAYPTSLLPGFLLMPELDQAVYEGAEGWLSLTLSGLSYLAVAAMWSNTRAPRRSPTDPSPIAPPRPDPGADQDADAAATELRDGREVPHVEKPPPAGYRDLWWPYRVHFSPRLVAIGLLLLVPLYALNFAPGVGEVYASSFGDEAPQAQVMANLLYFFIWVVVAYLFFISPGLNLELEQRELDGEMQRFEARLEKKRPVWIIGAAALSVILMLAIVLLRLT